MGCRQAPESRREKLKNSILAVLGRPNNLDTASQVIAVPLAQLKSCEKRRTRRQGGISSSACSTCRGASSKARITSSSKESDSWCWVGTSNGWPKTTPSCSLGKNGVSWRDNGAKTEHGGNGCSSALASPAWLAWLLTPIHLHRMAAYPAEAASVKYCPRRAGRTHPTGSHFKLTVHRKFESIHPAKSRCLH